MHIEPQYLRQLFPRPYPVVVDFDGNGVLDSADSQAFLSALAAHELIADRNLDGAWDETDFALWQQEFEYEISIPR